MKEKRRTREGKIVAAGVCLVLLVVAAFVGYRIYQSRHYRLPFDPNSVESVVMYRVQVSNEKKKVINRQEDVAEIAALINGMRVRGPLDSHRIPYAPSTFLSFRTSDGGVFNCLLTYYGSGPIDKVTSAFIDGDRRFEMDLIDLQALWDGLDYEEQEASYRDEIDTYRLTLTPPERIPEGILREWAGKRAEDQT